MVFPDSTQLHHANVTTLATATVATAGEALMDMVTEADGRLLPCDGGAVYNFTRALGLQGVPTVYLNPLSHDRFGQGLRAGLRHAGVAQARPEPVAAPTSLAVVGLDDAGKASYSFYREGVADRDINATGLNAACEQAAALQIVATGCLALVPDDRAHYLPWLQTQRARGRCIVVDANLRPAIVPDMAAYRASVRAALQEAHVIKVSDDDLWTLGLNPNTDPIAAAHALLLETRATTLTLTLGAKGAVLLLRDGRAWHARETQAVTVADTVGAGDCFLAGWVAACLEQPEVLLGLIQGDWQPDTPQVQPLLARAIASASYCVQQTGCVPPTEAHVLARMADAPVVCTRLQKVPTM